MGKMHRTITKRAEEKTKIAIYLIPSITNAPQLHSPSLLQNKTLNLQLRCGVAHSMIEKLMCWVH